MSEMLELKCPSFGGRLSMHLLIGSEAYKEHGKATGAKEIEKPFPQKLLKLLTI